MIWFIIVLLSIMAGVSITLLVLTKNEIRNITNNLKEINETRTNKKIMLSSPNHGVENLAKEINKTIEQKQRTEIQYKNMDLELRQAIANISHDLRTPLTSIIGYIQLMKDKSLTLEEKDQYADIVLKRGKSLQMLISSFFDLSRLEAKEYSFELKHVNISDILCELIASYYNDFLNRGIEPEIHIDQLTQQVIADENGVRRIFTNLLQNALKYGEKFIAVSSKLQNNYIVTRFTNDAPQLTHDDVEHLFERFFTGDRMRSGQNTGLGLAISKALALQMGSTIDAELIDGNLSIIIKWKIR